MKKFKFFVLLFLVLGMIIGKYIFFDYPVSRGRRAGNLTKISKKGKFLKTWEGTIDEGSGDKLTSYFSVKSDKIGKELFNLKQRKVVVYYEEYFSGWPRETKYNVVSWEPLIEGGAGSAASAQSNNQREESNVGSGNDSAVELLSRTLFCSALGTLLNDADLYLKVKEHLKNNNKYIFNQISNCNKTVPVKGNKNPIEYEKSKTQKVMRTNPELISN